MHRRPLVLTAASLGLGVRAAPVSPSNDIVLGRFDDPSRPDTPTRRDFLAGIRLAIDSANARGGIVGRKLRWVTLDTRQPAQMLAIQAQRLSSEPDFAAWLGDVDPALPATLARMPDTGRAPSVGGLSLADSQRAAMRDWHFHVRATQAREAEALARQLATVRLNRVTMVCPNDPAGAAVGALISRAFERSRIPLLAQATVTNDAGTIQEATRKLTALDPQAVVMALPAVQAIAMMEAAAELNRHPGFYSMSMDGAETAAAAAMRQARGLAVAQVVPFPWGETEPQVLAYRRLCGPAQVNVSYASLEGYVTAQVLIEALRRCDLKLTRPLLRHMLRTLSMTWGGMEIDFGRDGSGGSRYVELVQVGAGGRYVR